MQADVEMETDKVDGEVAVVINSDQAAEGSSHRDVPSRDNICDHTDKICDQPAGTDKICDQPAETDNICDQPAGTDKISDQPAPKNLHGLATLHYNTVLFNAT